MATNKAKRSIHLTQPNHSPTELMPVKSHVYHAIAEFNAGLEKAIESAIDHGEHNSIVGLKPELAREIVNRMRARLERTTASAVAVTTSGARHFLRQLVESTLPNLTILSHNEIPAEVRVRSLGILE